MLVAAPERRDAAIPEVLRCLEDEDWYVRMLAASSLSLLKDRRTVEALVESFDADIGNFPSTLKTITGRGFGSREEAVSWWKEHQAEYPPQLRAAD